MLSISQMFSVAVGNIGHMKKKEGGQEWSQNHTLLVTLHLGFQ